jgi:hypothetical protein
MAYRMSGAKATRAMGTRRAFGGKTKLRVVFWQFRDAAANLTQGQLAKKMGKSRA